MSEDLFPVKPHIQERAHIKTMEEYQRLYRLSLDNPEWFWGEQAKSLTWFHPWQSVFDADYREVDFSWFSGGRINACFNCVDRHLPHLGDKTALIWAQDEPGQYTHITYRDLKHQVARVANVLLHHGVKKGDRVCIYLTMIPELVYTMLACARIGAVHSVVFGGFSAEALRDRIVDARCKVVVTANEGLRGGKRVPLKRIVDRAIEGMSLVETVLVARRTDELSTRNEELSGALGRVRQLSGLLPICSCCKKIRDDRGYWNQLEQYFSEHSDVGFSHGICPECVGTMFPGRGQKPGDTSIQETPPNGNST